MKKLNLLCICIVLFSIANAQTQNLQSYNGIFNTKNFNGNAFYKYYDNSDSRIFEGDFKFTSSNKLVSITGKFANNLKTGTWKFNLTNYLFSDLILNYTITSNASGNYENSLLTGNWILQRTKVISFSKSGISEYYQSQLSTMSYLFSGETPDYNKKQTITETSNVNFKENHFVGKFSYILNNGKSKVIGDFSDEGYFNGTWISNYFENGIPCEEIRIYNNGVLSSVKIKDNSTGQVTSKLDKVAEINELFQNYIPNENSSFFKNQYYKLASAKGKFDDGIVIKAIDVWFNNSSISTSSYSNEIQIGLVPMVIYPERTWVYDNEKTEQKRLDDERKAELLIKEKQAKEDSIRQIKIAKENQERKIKEEQERKYREFEYSNYNRICKQIQTEFNAWALKNDSETTDGYKNRITSNSTSEFEKIVTKTISNSRKHIQASNRHAMLGEYDVNSEYFALQTFDASKSKLNDTIKLKISKNIAKDVRSNFSNGYYPQNQIIVIPQDYIMMNNNWVLSSAIIIFNSRYNNETWFGIKGGYTIEKLKNGNIVFSSGFTTPELKNHKIKNLNESSTFDDDLFYYEWTIINNPSFNPDKEQKLDFTFETLNITLPKF